MNSASRARPLVDLLLVVVLVLCIVRLWLMPIASSFWVDEMGTVFVARYGASHPSLRAAPQVPESTGCGRFWRWGRRCFWSRAWPLP